MAAPYPIYDALDRLTSLSRPGDLQSVFAHDPLGRVTAIEHAHDGTPVIELGYVYDAVGNLVDRSDDQGTAYFAYDDLDRLTSADYPGTDDYAYVYDAVGNLLSITTPQGTTNHSYDAADRISDTGYVYDANGALLTDGTRSFTYDALGRLTGVSGPSLSASYTLDGDGNRLSETVDWVTTDFDLDLRGLPSVLVAGDKTYLPGMPSLGHASSGAWLSALTDGQGSLLATIDSAGITSALVRYDPYGGLRPGSAATAGIGYTGEWTDPTGLVNLRFRAYDPSLGRFISRDTFGGLLTLPQSANRHAYALGNPLRHTDPSGHFVASLSGSGAPSPHLQTASGPTPEPGPPPCYPVESCPWYKPPQEPAPTDPLAFADDLIAWVFAGLDAAYGKITNDILAEGRARAEAIRNSVEPTSTKIPGFGWLTDAWNWTKTKFAGAQAWVIETDAAIRSGGTRLFGTALGAAGTAITGLVGFSEQWGADADRGVERRFFRATTRAVVTSATSAGAAALAGTGCAASGVGTIGAFGCAAVGGAAGAAAGNVVSDWALFFTDVVSDGFDWLTGR